MFAKNPSGTTYYAIFTNIPISASSIIISIMMLKLSLRCSHWVRRWSTIWRSPWHRHTPTTYLHRQDYHQDINPSWFFVIIFIKTIVVNLLIKTRCRVDGVCHQRRHCIGNDSCHFYHLLPFLTIFCHLHEVADQQRSQLFWPAPKNADICTALPFSATLFSILPNSKFPGLIYLIWKLNQVITVQA